MRSKTMRSLCWVLVVMMFGISSVWAARGKIEQAVPAELAEKVGELEAKFDSQLKILKAQIEMAIPNIAEAKKATTEAERKAAQKELVKWQENRDAGVKVLEERQAALDRAKLEEPQAIHELEAAEKALAEAQANALKALDGLDLADFLTSDKLDVKLAKYSLLSEATPRGLVVPEAERHPQLNAVRIPDSVDDATVRKRLLEEHGLEIGAGLGPLAGKVWRIGLLGYAARSENVIHCLNALCAVM